MKGINTRLLTGFALLIFALFAAGCAAGPGWANAPYNYGYPGYTSSAPAYGSYYNYQPYAQPYAGYGAYSPGYGAYSQWHHDHDISSYGYNRQYRYNQQRLAQQSLKNQQTFNRQYARNQQTFNQKYQKNLQTYTRKHQGAPVTR